MLILRDTKRTNSLPTSKNGNNIMNPYESNLDLALIIAAKAHKGQTRKFGQDEGEDYFMTHLYRVTSSVPLWVGGVAVLHDVIEDTEVTENQLRQFRTPELGTLPNWVVDTVVLLSRDKTQDLQDQLHSREYREHTYAEYIDTLVDATGVVGVAARLVKMADLMDNMSSFPASMVNSRYIKALDKISTRIRKDYEAGWRLTYESGAV